MEKVFREGIKGEIPEEAIKPCPECSNDLELEDREGKACYYCEVCGYNEEVREE